MLTRGCFSWSWLAFYFVSLSICYSQSNAPTGLAQVASPTQAQSVSVTDSAANSGFSSQIQSIAPVYLTEQQALANGMMTLLANGATLQQVQAWEQQNAAAISAQRQRAVAMANASASQTMPMVGQPNMPANASQTLKDFLTTQATLADARAQIHNQLLQQTAASGQALTQEQVAQMELQEMQAFEQQHANDLKAQAQRAQTLANASASALSGLPTAPFIPANASPQLAALLKAKYQLSLSQLQVLNQNLTASPRVQAAALLQWQQQNASTIAQLHQLEHDVPSENPSPQN